MAEEVSVLRLHVLRCMYLLNFALVGSGVCVSFVQRQEPWDPVLGVAFSFWAALAGLSALGIRYPLAMLPLLFMQLFYKTFGCSPCSFPSGRGPLIRSCARLPNRNRTGPYRDSLAQIAIPWPNVLAHYMKNPGDRWR